MHHSSFSGVLEFQGWKVSGVTVMEEIAHKLIKRNPQGPFHCIEGTPDSAGSAVVAETFIFQLQLQQHCSRLCFGLCACMPMPHPWTSTAIRHAEHDTLARRGNPDS